MDRRELLAKVNRRNASRFGREITESMLDDLVEERVIPGPKRKSSGVPRPDYQYDNEALRQLIWVRWLKARGLRRNSQLRIYLWLAFFNVPFDYIRRDAESEFSRARRKLLRGVSSTFEAAQGPPTERDVATLNRQLGSLDPRLLPGDAGLPPLGVVDVYSLMRFGHAGATPETLYRPVLDRLGLNHLPEDAFERLIKLMFRLLYEVLSATDESQRAIEGIINQIPECKFARARGILDLTPWLLARLPRLLRNAAFVNLEPFCRVVARTLFQPEFRISFFVLLGREISNGTDSDLFSAELVARLRSLRDDPHSLDF